MKFQAFSLLIMELEQLSRAMEEHTIATCKISISCFLFHFLLTTVTWREWRWTLKSSLDETDGWLKHGFIKQMIVLTINVVKLAYLLLECGINIWFFLDEAPSWNSCLWQYSNLQSQWNHKLYYTLYCITLFQLFILSLLATLHEHYNKTTLKQTS